MKHSRLSSALRSLCFILSFVTFLSMFPCLSVKASDFSEQLGIEQEEFDSMLEEDKTVTFDMPYTLEETGKYIKQEIIQVSTNGYEFYWEHTPYIDYVSPGTSDLAFGTTKVITNNALIVRMTLYNNGKTLFGQSGTLYLKLVAYSTKGTLKITKVGDVISEIPITCDPSDLNAMIELEIPNLISDIVRIDIILDGPVKQGTGDNYLAGGIVNYGYITTGGIVDGSEDAKNIFELLGSFFGNFWNNIMASVSNVFSFFPNFISGFWTNFTNKIEEGYNYLSEKVSGVFQYLKDFIFGFWGSLEDGLENGFDYLTGKVSELFQYFKDFVLDFWNSFKEKLESGFDYLTDKIFDLFLPPRGYIKNWINAYYVSFTDKMGAFGYLQQYLVDLVTVFYTYDYGEPILTFPQMAITIPNYGTYVICEKQEINLNDLVKDIPNAVDLLHFGTDVVMAFWLVGYSRKVVNNILK